MRIISFAIIHFCIFCDFFNLLIESNSDYINCFFFVMRVQYVAQYNWHLKNIQ